MFKANSVFEIYGISRFPLFCYRKTAIIIINNLFIIIIRISYIIIIDIITNGSRYYQFK